MANVRYISCGFNTARSIKQRHIKLCIPDNIAIVMICIVFTIIGVLFTQNELYADQWYFEASVDGLFGNDNRSLFMLCSNYLLEGFIYLLSLTGLRLHWCNIIFIFMNLISSILVCKVIKEIENEWHGYFLCVDFLLLITIYVYFFFQFTTIATYAIASGCLWIFYSIERRKPKRYGWFGIIWVVLGAAIRIESIAFSLVFMGIVWLFKMIELFRHNQLHFMSRGTFLRYFMPFGIALILVVGMETSKQVLMEQVNPGFKKWNDTRCLVDDYDMPDYNIYASEYQKIGLSQNDYDLLNDENNYDPLFFTDNLYEELLQLKNEHGNNLGWSDLSGTFLIDILKRMTGSVCLIVGLTISVSTFIYVNAWAGVCCIILVLASWGLHAYFTFVGRLIERTEYSTWIVMLIAMVAALLVLQSGQENVSGQQRNKIIIIDMLCLAILFVPSNFIETSRYADYFGSSIVNIYKAQILNSKTYARFLYRQKISNPTENYGTYDMQGINYIVKNKEFLFFISSSDWLMPFPLPGVDILRTAPIGTGDNWCVFGQNWTHLQPMKRILKKWGIISPFQSMTDNNIRVVFKDVLMRDNSYVINTYLKEHYYTDVNFSIDAIVNHTVIGRYMQNFNRDDLVSIPGKFCIAYSRISPYVGMSQIQLSEINVNNFSLSRNKAYIEIHSSDGHTYTCAAMDDGKGNLISYFYNDIIRENVNYTVDFIYSFNGHLYVVDTGGC